MSGAKFAWKQLTIVHTVTGERRTLDVYSVYEAQQEVCLRWPLSFQSLRFDARTGHGSKKAFAWVIDAEDLKRVHEDFGIRDLKMGA